MQIDEHLPMCAPAAVSTMPNSARVALKLD
jgi:hypothetical protein